MRKRRGRSRSKGEVERPIAVTREGLGKVVVLAEHRTRLRHAMRDALEERGYTVLEAADGIQALHLASDLEEPPDLVLAERDLAGLSAHDLVEEMEHAHVRTRVAVISADAVRHSPAAAADHLRDILGG